MSTRPHPVDAVTSAPRTPPRPAGPVTVASGGMLASPMPVGAPGDAVASLSPGAPPLAPCAVTGHFGDPCLYGCEATP